MAARFTATSSPDDIYQLLYLKNAQGLYRGFKTGYISQNLTEVEYYLMTCTRCKGIIREASSCEGETVCRDCNTNQLNPKRVQKVIHSVAELKIKCPLLRDCGWSGKLLEGEKHLKECGGFLIRCPLGCGDVVKRCQMNYHLYTTCLYRGINCEFCDLSITFKKLTEHLLTCPAHPIVCKCRRSIRRDEIEKHTDKDCELTEIECPYAKYSCNVGKIPRKDLFAHKQEFYIEHQDMFERKYDKLKEKNDQSVLKHNLLMWKMKEKISQLVQKQDLLEGKYDQLKDENTQLVQEHLQMENNITKLEHEQLRIERVFARLEQESRIRKKLLGVTVALNLKSEINQSSKFSNGQYKLVCNVSLSADSVEISLKRSPTSTYSDKKVLSITEYVLRLQETTREILPYLVSERICSRLETGGYVPIMHFDKKIFSRYQQPSGIVVMELYFDYDCVAYKGLFS